MKRILLGAAALALAAAPVLAAQYPSPPGGLQSTDQMLVARSGAIYGVGPTQILSQSPATTTTLGGVTVSTGLGVTSSGALSVAYGTTAGTAAQGNDSRFSVPTITGGTINGVTINLGATTGALTLPNGTSAQRPDSGGAGEVRFNTTTGRYEFRTGTGWQNFVALGGDTLTGTYTGGAFTGGDVSGQSVTANGGSVARSLAGRFSLATSVAAAGATQGTATPVTAHINVVTTVPVNAGVILPPCTGPDAADIVVVERGANALTVYPDSGSQIESYGINNAVSMAVGGKAEFICTAASLWRAF